MIPINIHPVHSSDFLHGILSLGYVQINDLFNDNGRLLDLIFTNELSIAEIVMPHSPLTNIDSFHPPLLLNVDISVNLASSIDCVPQRNFIVGDYIGFCNFLNESNVMHNLARKSLEEKISFLYTLLDDGISRFVPFSKRRRYKLPWWNASLQNLKNKRNKEWKRFRLTGENSTYAAASSHFDSLNMVLYKDYVSRMETSLKNNPSSFWRFVKSKRSTDTLPKLLKHADRSSVDINDHVAMFAEFFAENFSPSISRPLQMHAETDEIDTRCFQLDEFFVFDELLKIKTSTNAGPDGIHPLILKNCASLLFEPLTLIFNDSLRTGVFPTIWKSYSVTPIFKKGLRANVENYRGIAKLQTLAKFFEHCVNVHLVRMVSPKISSRQHGFMKARSTMTNMMEFVHYAKIGLNSANRVDVLYLDFSKAFDRVNHNILLHKLITFDLPRNVLSWLESYLSYRRQYVKLHSVKSNDFIVNSGVPQGSHIGPTLFLAFINDLPSTLSDGVFVSMFADDIRIAKTISSPNDEVRLQLAIDDLRNWCNVNDLHLNLDKCSIMSLHHGRSSPQTNYYYGSHRFSASNEQRDLGLLIDNKLSFRNHIEFIVSKSFSALGFVKRFCYDITDQTTLKAVYSAFVQSGLDYCSNVWLPITSTRSDSIESVLRQFSMYALREYPSQLNNYQISSYDTRLKKLNMISLHRRRIQNALLFLFDLANDNIHCPFVKELFCLNLNVRNLRDVEHFKITDLNLSRTPNAPITIICKYANIIKNLFIQNPSRNQFKQMLFKLDDDIFQL